MKQNSRNANGPQKLISRRRCGGCMVSNCSDCNPSFSIFSDKFDVAVETSIDKTYKSILSVSLRGLHATRD